MSYLTQFSTRRTSQRQAIPGSQQVKNSAGGFAWEVDKWDRLMRFLILGSEGGSYYATEQKLTTENATCVLECVNEDAERAVQTIVEVSRAGRAPKNDPAIFALAVACSHGDGRKQALAAIPAVCRTGTHLFQFATFIEQFRGWGRGLRRAVGDWYRQDNTAYQAVKYRQRNGWTHRDLLRLAHPTPDSPEQDQLFRWIVGKEAGDLPPIVEAFEKAQTASTPAETVAILKDHRDLPREALNTDHLTSPDVWAQLVDNGMPLTALIRNLPTLTRHGLLAPMGGYTQQVCEQIVDQDALRKSRVHPLQVLVAMMTYKQGFSDRSAHKWSPVHQVVDALDDAFYASFGNVEPSNKRTMLSLDVSGSMGWPDIAGMPGITPRIGSAAMAMVTARVEPQYMVTVFSTQFAQLPISSRQRLDDVVGAVSGLPFGGTDCSLPMLAALHEDIPIDLFVIYTDSETWAGRVHPSQALREYREKSGIDAKLVVVGMVSNGFSIADPNDVGMLDVVGFDTATPGVIAEFAA